MSKKNIAIIVQRYGTEICGGGEYYAKQLAEHLVNDGYDVEVITTTSLEYMSWDNHYQAGSSFLNGVKVTRFKPLHERDWNLFNKLCEIQCQKINSDIPTIVDDDNEWLDAQGPYCPALLEYIKDNKDRYDVVFVVTYIYYTAAKSIPLISEKCVFIPTAHDDIWIRLSIFKEIFSLPRYYAFLTEGEMEFVRNYFSNRAIPGRVVGFGVDIPSTANGERFKKKFNIKDKYLVYVGRVDVSKSCDEMISFFHQYKDKYKDRTKLVLIGENIMDIPDDDDIIKTGFVSEEEKFDGIMGSEAMICPSKFESLCIALLEGMACGKPILANKACVILDQQCSKSGAGFSYANVRDFLDATHKILYDYDLYKKMSKKALNFINKYYTWHKVLKEFEEIIELVADNKTVGNGQRIRYSGRNVLFDKEIDKYVIKIDNNTTSVEPAFSCNNIPICFTSSDEFAPMLGVALYSLIKNASDKWHYDINIFISDMSYYNMYLLKSLAGDRSNISIRFINLSEKVKSVHYKVASYYNKFTFYRLFIPDVMSNYGKILYLDSDLVVNHDISELYKVDLEDNFMAAVTELTVLCWQLLDKGNEMKTYLDGLGLNNIGGYIQGGVCLYNIGKFNKELPSSKLLEIATSRSFLMADQDIVNIYCEGKIKILQNQWNVVNLVSDNADLYNKVMPQKYFDNYCKARKNPYIIHFSGQAIPCLITSADLYHYFWLYARETPFYEHLIYHFRENRLCSVEQKINNLPSTNIVSSVIKSGGKSNVRKIADKLLPPYTRRRAIVKKIYNRIKGH